MLFSKFILGFYGKSSKKDDEDTNTYNNFYQLPDWRKENVNKATKSVFWIGCVLFLVITAISYTYDGNSLFLMIKAMIQGDDNLRIYYKKALAIRLGDAKKSGDLWLLGIIRFLQIFSLPFVLVATKAFLNKFIKKEYGYYMADIESENYRAAQSRQKQRDEEENRKRAIALRENQERQAYQKQLQEIEDREYAKAKGQSKALMSLYERQLELLQDHKRRGMDIEKETFDLRKQLLELERQENNGMINDLLKTLDRL